MLLTKKTVYFVQIQNTINIIIIINLTLERFQQIYDAAAV